MGVLLGVQEIYTVLHINIGMRVNRGHGRSFIGFWLLGNLGFGPFIWDVHPYTNLSS